MTEQKITTLKVRIKAWDATGHTFHDCEELSGSPLKQFLQLILLRMFGADVANMVERGGTTQTARYSNTANMMDATGAAGAFKGISIGTDNTAVDIEDYTLGSRIAHGTGAGEMLHEAQSYPSDVTTSDPNVTFETSRNFNNNSGVSITIQETAIYAEQDCLVASGYFCILRDTPTPVTVPDGGGATVTYTLTITE